MLKKLLSGSLGPLRSRDFSLLWSASLISGIGTWMQTVAVGALVTARTGQASWTALVAVAAFLPIGLLAPVGGALADRLDRRRWLAIANLVEAGLATLLTVLSATGRASPAVVTLVVLANGCVTALAFPFYQAIIPDLVGPDELLAASSLGMAQYNLGRVVGPALAGLVIAATSFTAAFALNAVSFLAVVAALVVIRVPEIPASGDDAGIWTRIVAGAGAARAEPGCRAAISLIAFSALLVSPFIALVPAKAHLISSGGDKATASATAALTTAQGIGAVAGALMIAGLAARFGRRRLLVFCLLATPAALCVYAATPSVTSAVAALALVGALYIGILSGLSTVVLVRAPAEFRARVLSLYFVALGTIYPLGALLQGAVADRVGLGWATAGGASLLVALVLAIGALKPDFLGALDDPVTQVEHPPVAPDTPTGAGPPVFEPR
ncbi:MAG TPA: MFS transporter [Acidimicrobiales bacterium]|nr:MFS transporter [Acidimicrobiales bacterium]